MRNHLAGPMAALILLSVSPGRAVSAKDGFLAAPYALKTGAMLYSIPLAADLGPSARIVSGWLCLGVAVPDILVLAALATGGGEALESRRRLAFWTEMGAATGLVIMGGYHAAQDGSTENAIVAWGYWFLALPILLFAQFNHIPFDAEEGAPPPSTTPVLRIAIPF